MTQEIQLLTVPFYGAEITIIEHDEQPYVVMKTVVESIELAWQPQHEKLKTKFAKGITEIMIPSNGGLQAMTCMSLRKLPAWLYSINPNKVPEHKREKIITFQEECDEVLWQYWTTGIAKRDEVKAKLAELEEAEKLSKAKGSEAGRQLNQRKREKKEHEVKREQLRQYSLFQYFNF